MAHPAPSADEVYGSKRCSRCRRLDYHHQHQQQSIRYNVEDYRATARIVSSILAAGTYTVTIGSPGFKHHLNQNVAVGS